MIFNNKLFSKHLSKLIIASILLLLSSCYSYTTQEPALVKNIDIEQSLKVSEKEIKKDEVSQSMCIWVLRDQLLSPEQAHIVADLYLSHIDQMKSEFSIWHASWGIANLYRLGNAQVKAELEPAYQKAKVQPDRIESDIKEVANNHINGIKLETGFIHFGGLFYAYAHLVVPGNKKYLQSYEEYLEKEEK